MHPLGAHSEAVCHTVLVLYQVRVLRCGGRMHSLTTPLSSERYITNRCNGDVSLYNGDVSIGGV